MAGVFLSVPIMRPNQYWTVLHVSMLAVLLLTLNADSGDSDCFQDIKVRRYTVYYASLGEDLTVECPVSFCNNSPPTVFWYKLESKDIPVNISSGGHIRAEWKMLNHSEGISFLIFKNILSSDSGQYRCQNGNSMGHTINISVDGLKTDKHLNVTIKNITSTTTPLPDYIENLWMYVYSAAGIVVFVFVVIIISVISMRGCKGKSKKETQLDSQYMEIPMVEQPPLHASIQPPPRGSPSALPSRRSTRKKAPPSRPNEVPLPRDNGHVHGIIIEDRERQRNREVEEEGSSVVYAALNHQQPARPPARPRIIQEERSEYAAIRVSHRPVD